MVDKDVKRFYLAACLTVATTSAVGGFIGYDYNTRWRPPHYSEHSSVNVSHFHKESVLESMVEHDEYHKTLGTIYGALLGYWIGLVGFRTMNKLTE